MMNIHCIPAALINFLCRELFWTKRKNERQPSEVEKNFYIHQEIKCKTTLPATQNFHPFLRFLTVKLRLILNMAIFWMSVLLSYIFVSSDAGYFNGRPGNDEFAISADIAPSGSCSAIGQIDTLLQCFKECLGAFRTFYMFSRDSVTLSCLCCKDPPSFSLPGNA